ncbi:site-2 protease family protein [Stieleria sp. JC731]|uniref:site-2 protease family protein n=1 Tax=Pirellulaceae TaxID=2691357 RepID=UPI001E5EEBD2|nr:site-2 protease family protein [Stieleria sp. JC731]MCC9602633.1 site-2 protease family protein [Stieleria sp. JC731]
MNGSYRLGKFADIDVYVHWTFMLLLAWVGGSAIWGGATFAAAIVNVTLVICVFACVLAHEYGHALAARRYGIPTHDITLLPIGGVARLREIPERPREELVVAIAGPAVNVVIATFLAGVLAFLGSPMVPESMLAGTGGAIPFLQSLMSINVMLVLFNLIPAFPMDGGRMLRALLAMKLNRIRATDIAATVGQVLSFGLGFMGLFGNPFLILIAVFVFFGARAEAQHVRSTTLVSDLPVRAAMIAHMQTAQGDDHLQHLRDLLLDGSQQDFPVLDEHGDPVGLIYRNDIVNGLQRGMQHARVHTMMHPLDEVSMAPSDSLRSAMVRLQDAEVPALLVINGGRLVGLLTRENIAELLIFRETDPEFVPPVAFRRESMVH